MSKLASLTLVALALVITGCADEQPKPVAARRAFAPFAGEVYDVLLRDCGFPSCHGAPERFFRVYGPGRVRLPGDDGVLPEPFDTPTVDEQSLTFQLALSMIKENELGDSPLLRKPLAVEAGGYGHLGIDGYGRDVYRTTQDIGYVKIARWVYSPPPMMAGAAAGAGGAGGAGGAPAP
jgi:hypothetical protein